MRKSYRVAVGGLTCALAVMLMFVTGFVPVGTYLFPAMAGALLMVIALEFGLPWAYLVFLGVSLLSLLVTPDREAALLFVAFFGHYPSTKQLLDRIPSKLVAWAVKLLLFNLTMIASYWLITALFGYTDLKEELGFLGQYGPWIFLGLSNPVFVMLDVCLDRMRLVYMHYLRKQFMKKH